MRRKVISTVDRYIFIQFLATYFFSIVLILAVAIAFDVTEKLDKLLQPDARYELSYGTTTLTSSLTMRISLVRSLSS